MDHGTTWIMELRISHMIIYEFLITSTCGRLATSRKRYVTGTELFSSNHGMEATYLPLLSMFSCIGVSPTSLRSVLRESPPPPPPPVFWLRMGSSWLRDLTSIASLCCRGGGDIAVVGSGIGGQAPSVDDFTVKVDVRVSSPAGSD